MAQPQPQWREPERVPEVAVERRDQVRWGPIWGGVFTTIATVIVLSVLGVAIGLSIFDAANGGLAVAGVLWGIIVTVAAFFLGGYVAGRTSTVSGPLMGAFNGAMVWALALVLTLVLTALGLGGVLGLTGAFGGVVGGQPLQLGPGATGAAWGTFAAMVVGLIVAALGGYVGAPRRNGEARRSPR